ncbi:hypothetical protein PTKIN_Ptkin16aG0504200 [Pterospermum kingtungense]
MADCKIGDSTVRRDVLLKAEKLTVEQGVERRTVATACESAEETMKIAVELGEKLAKREWDGKIYGENRKDLYREILE